MYRRDLSYEFHQFLLDRPDIINDMIGVGRSLLLLVAVLLDKAQTSIEVRCLYVTSLNALNQNSLDFKILGIHIIRIK